MLVFFLCHIELETTALLTLQLEVIRLSSEVADLGFQPYRAGLLIATS